ncbi:MAG: chemotaxis protein CheB, partial [Bryobacteraceae bacterium]
MAFPIVGIGASAGGLEAFTMLLECLPATTGMAFVLIRHLEPRHQSHLTELLVRKSAIPIREVKGPTPVEPNHVYVIPSGSNLTIVRGILNLSERPHSGARNLPIDDFLQALSNDRQCAAVAVILSGTATDGAMGVRAIKDNGGITFAQEPSSAKFDGMPRSAIVSGAVDFILPPDDIARQLVELASHPYLTADPASEPLAAESAYFNRIFKKMRTLTGIDFTYYKRNTVFRRTKRRMALQNIHDLKVYCFLVEQSNKEADALAQDLLVNVTSFFRDPEVYRAMREIIFPMFLEGRSREDPIRIWIPGCSTGEEAYSLAIELTEFLDQQSIQPVIQIFATDLSEAAIQKARAAVYLESSVTGISPERMRRFFVKRARVYQIAQPLRDICVFARQDVTRDPPFSKIDLISCCNLLIYLGPAAQRRALSVFHYALKSKGILVLGSSESVGPLPECFQAIDRESRIFARKGTSSKLKLEPYSRRSSVSVAVPDWVPGDITAAAISIRKEAERMLLAEYAPASVIVDESDRVIQVIGQTDRYLHIPQGAPTDYLTPMIKPGLVAGLKSAVVAARKQNTPVSVRRLHVKEGRRFRMVDVRVCRMPSQLRETGFLLISFQDSREPAVSSRDIKKPEESKSDRQVVERQEHEIVRLEQELIATRDYLQAIVETQETSAEELRSATEEAEANNEELQAAREELQASNEELNTLNDELRIRNTEQNSLNGDLRKLLETISVPLVMVGKDLRIRWFTHAMETLLNLSPNDQGKLITDLRMTLIPIPDFVQMLVRALAGSEETTAEFQQPNGRWFSLRILPYSDGTEAIEGVIATLIDIDDLKRARDFAEA